MLKKILNRSRTAKANLRELQNNIKRRVEELKKFKRMKVSFLIFSLMVLAFCLYKSKHLK